MPCLYQRRPLSDKPIIIFSNDKFASAIQSRKEECAEKKRKKEWPQIKKMEDDGDDRVVEKEFKMQTKTVE